MHIYAPFVMKCTSIFIKIKRNRTKFKLVCTKYVCTLFITENSILFHTVLKKV